MKENHERFKEYGIVELKAQINDEQVENRNWPQLIKQY
jgi:hypothetical protein